MTDVLRAAVITGFDCSGQFILIPYSHIIPNPVLMQTNPTSELDSVLHFVQWDFSLFAPKQVFLPCANLGDVAILQLWLHTLMHKLNLTVRCTRRTHHRFTYAHRANFLQWKHTGPAGPATLLSWVRGVIRFGLNPHWSRINLTKPNPQQPHMLTKPPGTYQGWQLGRQWYI